MDGREADASQQSITREDCERAGKKFVNAKKRKPYCRAEPSKKKKSAPPTPPRPSERERSNEQRVLDDMDAFRKDKNIERLVRIASATRSGLIDNPESIGKEKYQSLLDFIGESFMLKDFQNSMLENFIDQASWNVGRGDWNRAFYWMQEIASLLERAKKEKNLD